MPACVWMKVWNHLILKAVCLHLLNHLLCLSHFSSLYFIVRMISRHSLSFFWSFFFFFLTWHRYSCTNNTTVKMSKCLRTRIWNLLGFARAGLNPALMKVFLDKPNNGDGKDTWKQWLYVLFLKECHDHCTCYLSFDLLIRSWLTLELVMQLL